jgi:opacity protein-like surface antigen
MILAVLAGSAVAAVAGPFEYGKAPVEYQRNLYVYAYGGLNWLSDMEDDFVPLTVEFDDTGYMLGGGLGFRSNFLGGSRFEVDGAYRGNDDALTVPLSGGVYDVDQTSLHVNWIKEFNPGGYFIPYAGVGIGWTQVDVEVALGGLTDGIEADVFSWNAIGGIEAVLTEVLSLYTEYRYTALTGFGSAYDTLGGALIVPDGISNHSLLFGLRLYF